MLSNTSTDELRNSPIVNLDGVYRVATLQYDDLISYFKLRNMRFYKSMQWYVMSGRSIVNAKMIARVYFKGIGNFVIIVDYPEDQADVGLLNDRIVYMKLGTIDDIKLAEDKKNISKFIADKFIPPLDKWTAYEKERKDVIMIEETVNQLSAQ